MTKLIVETDSEGAMVERVKSELHEANNSLKLPLLDEIRVKIVTEKEFDQFSFIIGLRQSKVSFATFAGPLPHILITVHDHGFEFDWSTFRSIFFHEYTHLVHEHISKVISKLVDRRVLLERYVKKLEIGLASDMGSHLLWRREVLADFFQLLYIEGVAKFGEKYLSEKLQSEDDILQQVNAGEQGVYDLSLKITEVLFDDSSYVQNSGKGLVYERFFKIAPYVIGEYMAFVIVHTKRMSFDDLLRLQPSQFIVLYEACAHTINKVPVVSYTSGDGIIDYSRAVNKMKNEYDKYVYKK